MSAPLSRCFIGGWGTTEDAWRRVFDELLPAATATSQRTGAPSELTSTQFVSWLECLQSWPGVLERLAAVPGPFVLIGLSLGSVLALRAIVESSAQTRQKIAAMVMVSATPCMCARHDGGDHHGGIEPRVLAAMRARMRRSPDAVLEDFAAQCAAPDGDERSRLDWLRQARQFSSAELMAGLDALATLDMREHLEEITVPCRILHGECDRIVPLPSAQFLARRIAGAQLQVLAGRGHALPFTAAAEIAQCIASYQ